MEFRSRGLQCLFLFLNATLAVCFNLGLYFRVYSGALKLRENGCGSVYKRGDVRTRPWVAVAPARYVTDSKTGKVKAVRERVHLRQQSFHFG